MRTEPDVGGFKLRSRRDGLSSIQNAILQGDIQVLSEALRNGTDPNFCVAEGLTLLHYACMNGKAEAAEKILSLGADPDLVTNRGHTAAHLAAHAGDERTIRVLMKYADLNKADPANGFTPGHVAASLGRAQVLSTLCEVMDIESKAHHAMTPLHQAVQKGNIECVRILVKAGADVEAKMEPMNETALMLAAWKDDSHMVQTLLELGANVEHTQIHGRTATIAAAYNGSSGALRVLIDAGANLDVMDNEGYTALRCAVQWSKEEAALLLLDYRVRLNTHFGDHQDTVLHYAVSKGLRGAVEKLIGKGADLEVCDADGDTPLQWAVEAGKADLVDVLLKGGAKVNVPNHAGRTVLYYAVRCGHVSITQRLLQHGADPKLVDTETLQPAPNASSESYEACRHLLEHQDALGSPEKLTLTADIPSSPTVPEVQQKDEEEPDTVVSDPIRYRVIELPGQCAAQSLTDSLQNAIQHKGITCDGPLCKLKKESHVCGIRYRCMVCDNVDFCSKCISSFENTHDSEHAMIRCLVPTKFKKTEDIDDDTKRILLREHGDQNTSASDVIGVLVAEPEERDADTLLPSSVSDNLKQTVMIVTKPSRSTRLPPKDKSILQYGEKKADDSVIMYHIDEHANVRVKYQPLGSKSDARLDQESVLHHQNPALLTDVLFQKLKSFDYRSLPWFYKMISNGRYATRVIDILPGKFDDKLDVRLRAIDIHRDNYQALSYTWKETSFERAHWGKWTEDVNNTFKSMLSLGHAVYIQSEWEQSYLVINTGLRDALQRLRHHSQEMTLWADQICINQKHHEERQLQVTRMKHVFNRARRVLVWIGESDDYTGQVFEVIRKLAAAKRVLGFDPVPELVLDDDNLDLPPQGSPIWKAMLQHLNRPVFRRCWVIQEIVVAQRVTVCCGDFPVEWADVAVVLKLITNFEWLKILPMHELAEEENKGDKSQRVSKGILGELLCINGIREDFQTLKELTMEALVYLTRIFEATDPRDKIFSLLGIQGAQKSPQDTTIMPDYVKPIPEVFTEATKAIMQEAQSFGICGLDDSNLTKVSISTIDSTSTKPIKGLPSWVPDYSLTNDRSTSYNRPIPPPPYRASGDSDFLATWPHEPTHPSVLAASSYKAGTITKMSSTIYPDTSNSARGPVLEEWTRLASIAPQYVTGERISRAFIRTLVGDCTIRWRHRPIPPAYYLSIPFYILSVYIELLESTGRSMSDEPMYGIMGDMVQIATDTENSQLNTMDQDAVLALMSCANRRFFVTGDGYFGVGPRDMRVGDQVHVLSGGKVPFVLRRMRDAHEGGCTGDGGGGVQGEIGEKSEEKERQHRDAERKELLELAEADGAALYTMVGECYMHGIMDGEVLERSGFEWDGVYII